MGAAVATGPDFSIRVALLGVGAGNVALAVELGQLGLGPLPA
jgi:hypothetical protein